jgi:Flp pilus assembly protein TadG
MDTNGQNAAQKLTLRKGNTMIEFCLAAIPGIFLLISSVQMSIGMWQYHTLAHAVRQGAQSVVTKGHGCTTGGNTCGTTVGTIASAIANEAVGIVPADLNVTLTTASGSTQTCNPVSVCFSSTTTWPPSTNSDDLPGKAITIGAQYTFHSALSMFWPGAAPVNFQTVTFSATTTQSILF